MYKGHYTSFHSRITKLRQDLFFLSEKTRRLEADLLRLNGDTLLPHATVREYADCDLDVLQVATIIGNFTDLTPKQCEVAACVYKGYSNLEIAKRMNVSEKGIKWHITNMYAKFNVTKRPKFMVKIQIIIERRHHGYKEESIKENKTSN